MRPRIIAIGGATSAASGVEPVLQFAADFAQERGAEVTIFGRDYLLALPHYRGPQCSVRDGAELVTAVREADGLIIAAEAPHGSVSALVKNALEYIEDLAGDVRPYLEDRIVGLIALAHGDQARAGAVQAMRDVVHSLRGWTTPLAASFSYDRRAASADAGPAPDLTAQVERVVNQTVGSARSLAAVRAPQRRLAAKTRLCR